MESNYQLATKNGSAVLGMNSRVSSGKNTHVIVIDNHRVICNDRHCPDFGKLIEVYDLKINGHLLHIEKVETKYNVLLDKRFSAFAITEYQKNMLLGRLRCLR